MSVLFSKRGGGWASGGRGRRPGRCGAVRKKINKKNTTQSTRITRYGYLNPYLVSGILLTCVFFLFPASISRWPLFVQHVIRTSCDCCLSEEYVTRGGQRYPPLTVWNTHVPCGEKTDSDAHAPWICFTHENSAHPSPFFVFATAL